MIISAKFASVCPCCSVRIVPGTKVEWSKGAKAKHVDCGAAPVATTAPVSRPRQDLSRLDDLDLADRGLVRVSGPRGTYIRRATKWELQDMY